MYLVKRKSSLPTESVSAMNYIPVEDTIMCQQESYGDSKRNKIQITFIVPRWEI